MKVKSKVKEEKKGRGGRRRRKRRLEEGKKEYNFPGDIFSKRNKERERE